MMAVTSHRMLHFSVYLFITWTVQAAYAENSCNEFICSCFPGTYSVPWAWANCLTNSQSGIIPQDIQHDLKTLIVRFNGAGGSSAILHQSDVARYKSIIDLGLFGNISSIDVDAFQTLANLPSN